MKKRIVRRLGVVALALTLVSMTMMGGTLARYVTEVTGTATATVAAWSFKANGEVATMNAIDLGDTTHRTGYEKTTVEEAVIAPGTSGSFDIVLDGTGSEVGIDYTVKIAEATTDAVKIPSDLTFTVKNGESSTSYTLGTDITGKIDYNATDKSMKKTITVSWKWEFGNEDTVKMNDNAFASKTWNLAITAIGKQIAPVETTPPSA